MKKILIVEDEDIISRDIKSMIDQLGGYTAIVAHSGRQAITLHKQKNPDLVLMDINLSGELDGISTATEIRKLSDIPLIYLTAYADEKTVKRAKVTQPVGYILKPFNDTEVKANIELALYKHQINQKLLERERLLSSILTKIGLGIVKTDNLLHVQFINNVAAHICSVQESSVIGKSFTSVVNFIDEENGTKISAAELINSFTGTLVVNLRDKQIPIDLVVEPIRDDDENESYVFILRDLSEKRNIESRMWKSTNILERTIQSIQSAVFITSPDFIIKDCNKAASRIFGFSKNELLERNIDFLYSSPGEKSAAKSTLSNVIKNKMFYQAVETGMYRQNKRFFPAEFTIAPLIDERFNITGWVLTVTDILQKKNYENDLKNAKVSAENANKAKTEFLTNMSHELRTPLNSIIGMTELALGTKLTSEQNEYLSIVKEASHSFLHVLNNILDFSKLEVGKVELEETDFNIHTVLKDISDLLTVQARQKNLKFVVKIDPGIPENLRGDVYKLKQILTNLIANAIKFTDHGRIDVQINAAYDGPGRLILHCSVKDTGIGVPHNKKETIFESFRQIDGSMTRKYGGTGLGLAITKRLVSLMDGSIWIETNKEKGSAFHFTIKLKNEKDNSFNLAYNGDKIKIKKTDRRKQHRMTPGKTILVVEDDKNTQKIICDLLEKRGHSLFCVPGGEAAMAMLNKIKFDIILMDLKMPGLDGFATTKLIRSSDYSAYKQNIPIIAITAHAHSDIQDRCLQAGMNGFISKPIDFEKLINFIERQYTPHSNKKKKHATNTAKTAVIDRDHIIEYCTENNINPQAFYRKIHIDLDTVYQNLKTAAKQEDKNRLEMLSVTLKDIAGSIGAELLNDDALRIKMASRKKTMDKAFETLEKLKPHIENVEQALDNALIKIK